VSLHCFPDLTWWCFTGTCEAAVVNQAVDGELFPAVSDQFYSSLSDCYYDVYSDAYYDPGTP
jgi:hypothetical protein